MNTTLAMIRQWLHLGERRQRRAYDDLGLSVFLPLFQIQVCWNLILAASHFWNPLTHSFYFGMTEITPLPEEFRAILGYTATAFPVIPLLDDVLLQDFAAFFLISLDDLSSVMV